MSEGRSFPVLLASDERRRLGCLRGVGWCPDGVPWRLVEPHANQARVNHYQSLERLAERGGLCPSEMVAVLEDRAWERMPLEDAVERIRALLAQSHAGEGREP